MRGGPTLQGRAKFLRQNMTEAERILWRELRRHRLGQRFRRQFPVPPCIADFACIEARVIVEVDGGQHAEPGEHDRRDALLCEEGWWVLRFWNNDIFDNLTGVLETISASLAARNPHPDPPPLAGDGATSAGVSTSPSPASGGGPTPPPPQAGEGRGGGFAAQTRFDPISTGRTRSPAPQSAAAFGLATRH
jgi:very-short-patch-repair endonuclease